jgi:hypothetical protein
MSEISEPSNDAPVKPDINILRRILIIMTVLLIASIIVSLFLAEWHVTTGLMIGGLLSFVNFYWLKASLGRMLGQAAAGSPEPMGLWLLRYNLRFFSLVLVIIGVYLSGIVSLAALFGGLLSLAMAVTIEGFIQLFLAVFRREEI